VARSDGHKSVQRSVRESESEGVVNRSSTGRGRGRQPGCVAGKRRHRQEPRFAEVRSVGGGEPEVVSLKASPFRILWWMRKGRWKVKALAVGVLACFFVAPAMAQAGQSQTTRGADGDVRVATLDELRRELSPGDVISVVQTTGDSVRGRLRRFGDTDIDLETETQQAAPEEGRPPALTIPLSAIQALERPRDPSRNGALIGAGIGGGAALAVFVYAAAVDYNEIDEWGPTYLAIGGIYTGLGALAGWAIDRARSRPHIRFDAPSPGTVTIRAVPLLSRGPGMAMVLSF
jgi:hypothetical protein